MKSEMPSALIIGSEHFVAKKLKEEIIQKDINVVEIDGYEDLDNLNDEDSSFSYVFDFRCDPKFWNDVVRNSEKITLIKINENNSSERLVGQLKESGLNWRLIEAVGVYGPGMDIHEKDSSVGFLVEAICQSVANKNLVLPPANSDFHLLEVQDLVEAILRASFLSGMEEEVFLVAGEKTNSEIVAACLINEAKMTRFKVMPSEVKDLELDERRIKDSQRKLRWQPKIDFAEGIKETLQYFFGRIDEENRQAVKKTPVLVNKKSVVNQGKTESPKRIFEVMVETEEPVVEPEVKVEEDIPIEVVEQNPIVYEDLPVKKTFKAFPSIEEKDFEEEKEVKKIIIEEEMEEIKEIKPEIKIPIEEVKKIEIEENKTEVPKVIKVKKSKSRYWIMAIILVMLFISMPLSWGINTYAAINNVKKIENLVINKKYTEAKALSDKYLNKTRDIDENIDDWGLNKFVFLRNYQVGLKTLEELLSLEKKLIDLAGAGDAIDGAVFNDKKIDWNKQLGVVESSLKDVDSQIGILQARLSGDWSWLPGDWKSSLQKKAGDLNKIKIQLASVSQVVKIMPEFLGLDGKKREYLVLFQNETELRPGGGFIGSYGLLSFQGGKLLTFDIKDVYEADGQLVGHVEPPYEIKNYLGEGGWFLRDANWNANFPEAAVDLKWFLEKETGKKVDGVIGINLGVARAVLGAVGEVYVPDFKEKINKDNLYEQAEFYAESKFFPGSNQKASFLGGVGKQLFEEIRTLKMDQKMNLMLAIFNSLEKNDIQIALNKKEDSQIISDLGWDGSIYQGKCGVENCVSDYLYLVEANLGVNKANYFLYRSIEESVDISDQSLTRSVKINYENTAKNSNWPGGDYKNYLRVYLPKDINLSEISLTDGNNLSSRKVYAGDELRVREVNGKQEVGFLVTVPVSQKRIVEIKYSSNLDLSDKKKFSYVNYIQKQSGFGDTGIVNLISYPAGWQPTQVEPVANLLGGKLLFNQKLDGDIRMGVELKK